MVMVVGMRMLAHLYHMHTCCVLGAAYMPHFHLFPPLLCRLLLMMVGMVRAATCAAHARCAAAHT